MKEFKIKNINPLAFACEDLERTHLYYKLPCAKAK